VATGVEIGEGHAHSYPVNVVLGPEADASGVRLVDVRIIWVAGCDARSIERLLGRRPGSALVPPDRYRPLCAVEISGIIFVSFELPEVR
jgi:hypothetical protein